jgi:hypothetical protein
VRHERAEANAIDRVTSLNRKHSSHAPRVTERHLSMANSQIVP